MVTLVIDLLAVGVVYLHGLQDQLVWGEVIMPNVAAFQQPAHSEMALQKSQKSTHGSGWICFRSFLQTLPAFTVIPPTAAGGFASDPFYKRYWHSL